MIMIFRSYGSLEDIRYNINCTYIPAQKIFRSFHNFADEIVDLYSMKYWKKEKQLNKTERMIFHHGIHLQL